jgi:predicted DNA-binding transcriptional regulator AlpA
MPTIRKPVVDPNREPSLVMTLPEVLFVLRQALAPVKITDYVLYNWIERGYFPGAIALGGMRSHDKPHRVVWLTADVDAFLEGLRSQPRLKAPKTARGASQPA